MKNVERRLRRIKMPVAVKKVLIFISNVFFAIFPIYLTVRQPWGNKIKVFDKDNHLIEHIYALNKITRVVHRYKTLDERCYLNDNNEIARFSSRIYFRIEMPSFKERFKLLFSKFIH